jgi:hypothetical protein
VPHPEGHALVAALTGFGDELHRAGVPVGAGQAIAFARAMSRLDPADRHDLYWAGRACLVSRQEDIATYDAVFAELFGEGRRLAVRVVGDLPAVAGAPKGRSKAPSPAERARPSDAETGRLASDVDELREKDFASCSEEELADIARLLARVSAVPPLRLVRRTRPARSGIRPDLRRLLRELLRQDASAIPRRWRRRRVRPRSIVLLLDVSGSMSGYSRALLQFAYSIASGPSRVEVFCFGTRLTRVSSALARRTPDEALRRAAETVVDWDGGTRIGESVHQYVRGIGRRAGLRGAIVIVCSDGLERGDPELLAREMVRLGRLAHRVVWVNPLKGDASFEPITRGMKAALPSVHFLVSGHNLASLEELAALVDALA